MVHAPWFLLLLIFATRSLLPSPFPVVLAARNVTVDDTDPTIVYSPQGSWSTGLDDSTFWNRSFTESLDSKAVATFNFTGVAIYFQFPWYHNGVDTPILINAQASLDSAPPISIDSSPSNPSARQGILWSATGLENKAHTLQISPIVAMPAVLIDSLMYTDITDTPSPKRKRALAPALGAIFGTLGLLIIVFVMRHFWKRRRHRSVGTGTPPGEFRDRLDGLASSPTQPGSGQQVQQTPEGAENAFTRYAIVDASRPPIPSTSPPPTHSLQSPQTPAYGSSYQDENGYYRAQPYSRRPLPQPPIVDPDIPAPNQREATRTLLSTTEGSPSQMPGSGEAWDEVFAPNFT